MIEHSCNSPGVYTGSFSFKFELGNTNAVVNVGFSNRDYKLLMPSVGFGKCTL